MKKLLIIPFFLLLTGYDQCQTGWERKAAADHLGKDAVCGTGAGNEVLCIREGQRFSCLVNRDEKVACALISTTPAEAK